MSSKRFEPQAAPLQLKEFLTFFIAGVEYALSLEHVREVIPYDTVTRVPGMPNTVRGVTNLRGSVVPVIDLSIKFRQPQSAITSRTCIVLVESSLGDDSLLLGLLTEEVGQVLSVDAKELLAPPSFGTPVHSEYLEGMLPLGKKFALVLDIQRSLAQEEILAQSHVASVESAALEVSSAELLDDAWEAGTSAAGHGQEA